MGNNSLIVQTENFHTKIERKQNFANTPNFQLFVGKLTPSSETSMH